MTKHLASSLFTVLGIYLIIHLSHNLWRLWQAQKITLKEQVQVKHLSKKNHFLQQKLKQVSQDQFVEQQARNRLNLVKPGETLVILPDELLQQTNRQPHISKHPDLANWQKWWLTFKVGSLPRPRQ